jgi:hypothetical protein
MVEVHLVLLGEGAQGKVDNSLILIGEHFSGTDVVGNKGSNATEDTTSLGCTVNQHVSDCGSQILHVNTYTTEPVKSPPANTPKVTVRKPNNKMKAILLRREATLYFEY